MKIQEVASKYEKYQVEMRRYFHQYPEVSGKEYETSKKIKEELDKIGVPWVDCGLETGICSLLYRWPRCSPHLRRGIYRTAAGGAG